jgi:hypothetical protein
VTTTRAGTLGHAARWVLLSCTLFGLAFMHTLGHAGMRMSADTGVGQVVHVAAGLIDPGGSADSTAMATPSQECPPGHCDGHGGGGMSGWSVCLAVLTGLAAIVLLAALLSWASSGRRRVRQEPVGVAAAPRAPPRRPAGLLVASVAVLRI